jgi:hypothetical protein
MYYPNSIEDICYTPDHIQSVLAEISNNFSSYFEKFIESDNKNAIDFDSMVKLAEKFGNSNKPKQAPVDVKASFPRIVQEGIGHFNGDRKKYLDLLNAESIEEYENDPSHFKNTILRNQCPIIHHTLQNKQAKELDKYRTSFKISDPGDLLKVVKNIFDFSQDYIANKYKPSSFESIDDYSELNFSDLLTEDYIVFGVIGGGIKSHLLYKLNPDVFPNRSREAIWALWYLTSKKTFGCKEDSEFLMIDTKNTITQQNYFYPYDLFGYYALKIYNLLKSEASKYSIPLSGNCRFVIVDSFLSYIAKSHEDEINDLKRQIREDSYGY